MKKIISAVFVSLLLCAFTGCSAAQDAAADGSQTATDTAVIVVQGDGMPAVSSADADGLLNELSVKTGGSVTLIVADGAPQVYGPVRFDVVKNNSIQQAHVDEQYRADVLQAIEAVSAKTPETDIIGALQQASRAVKSGSASCKSLVIRHSGINTSSALPMQQLDLLAADPEQLVDRLADAGMVADFFETEINFFGLGDTAGSQPPCP